MDKILTAKTLLENGLQIDGDNIPTTSKNAMREAIAALSHAPQEKGLGGETLQKSLTTPLNSGSCQRISSDAEDV
jgi:hypothetical protein